MEKTIKEIKLKILEMKMVGANDIIPHILNGASANTMFVLINLELFISSSEVREKYHNNTSTYSLPWDLDDFGRCVNAANIFKWNTEDLNRAAEKAQRAGLGKKYGVFYKEFLIYKEKFENNKKDIVRDWIDFIHTEVG